MNETNSKLLEMKADYHAWDGKEREGMDKGGEEKTKKGSNGLMGEEESEFGFWERERECYYNFNRES